MSYDKNGRPKKLSSIALQWIIVAAVVVAAIPFGLSQIHNTDGFSFAGVPESVVHKGPPNAQMQAIAEATAMTTAGADYFYDAEPVIQAGDEYSESCSVLGRETKSLGCYDGTGIFIFAVDDPALAGTEEVTAAHEMLHAAWNDISATEQDTLGPLLLAAYDKAKADPDVESTVKSEMEIYDTTEVDNPEMINELHSILGTIAADVGPVLEAHYALYFSGRDAVLAQDASSMARLNALDAEITGFSAQVGALDVENAAAQAQLTIDADAHNVAITGYNSWVDGGSASYSAANARRAALNTAGQSITDRGNALDARIDSRNAISDQGNASAVEYNRLAALLDSTL